MAEVVERFPLFPLGLVLLPGETVPLHIFEERYKLMIGRCLDGQEEFGILWLADSGLREIGCAAEVYRVLERMDDGRLNVLVQGTQPFRLLRRIEDLPYPAGDVELLEDYAGEDEEGGAGAEARSRYADLVDRATDSSAEAWDLARMDAFDMAATIDFGPEDKQVLLELHSEEERLVAVTRLCDAAMSRLDQAEAAGERARSNGRLRSP